jgi:sugar transferase (PEP-CTERM/EpsH1 system associated)
LKILYLAHRIPYPPNKGDKIRSFHEIKHFSRHHEIHLLAFYDDPKEAIHAEDLKQFCKTVTLIPLHRRRQQARAIMAMLGRKPWTLGYFSNPQMWAAVRARFRSSGFNAIFVYSSSMAPYVAAENRILKILDFVDSDASKWLQYARLKPAPASWLYSYEGKNLLAFEKKMACAFDASVFVSPRDAGHLSAQEYRGKIHIVQNGIDLDSFVGMKNEEASQTIIFTGAMDYFPNIDAVSYFARDVFPLIRESCPHSKFMIVGSKPAPEVQRLAVLPGVQVTGTVPDVRPFLAQSKVAVVPVRISQGIQNKILEALAAGLPVVTTSAAAKGLTSMSDFALAVADEPKAYAERVITYLQTTLAAEQIAATRRRLKQEYDWDTNLSAFDRMFEMRTAPLSAG